MKQMAMSKLSIRKRLTLIIMVTTGVSLFVASAGFFAYDLLNFRKRMVTELSVLAGIMETNTAASVVFNDR